MKLTLVNVHFVLVLSYIYIYLYLELYVYSNNNALNASTMGNTITMTLALIVFFLT